MLSVQGPTPATAIDRDGSTVLSREGGTARPYYASIGPRRGPLIYSEALLAIGVTKRWQGGAAIGAALCVGRDETAVALWELTIGKVPLPGRWVVIDRQFRLPESAPGSAFPPPEPWSDLGHRRRNRFS
jgi:hypothetical protein